MTLEGEEDGGVVFKFVDEDGGEDLFIIVQSIVLPGP